jgi:hypothetical protein
MLKEQAMHENEPFSSDGLPEEGRLLRFFEDESWGGTLFDEELSVSDAIKSLTSIWTICQEIRKNATYLIDPRTVCYWLLRFILYLDLESDEINNLFNQECVPCEVFPRGIFETIEMINSTGPDHSKNFRTMLTPINEPLATSNDSNILTIPGDLFLIALRAVIQLADSGYFRPMNEATVDGIVTMAQAASTMDLSTFSPTQTSEIVAELAQRCVELNEGSLHLGLAIDSLRIIFEKMGRELSLKGCAVFVRAVNDDNSFYSPRHNTMLAKTAQPLSYWARRKRREEWLKADELYLLCVILSQTVAKTALVNVEERRIEFMELIKLYLEEQELLIWMLSNTKRILKAGLTCDLNFSEVQFLMFNHIIFGWCSGYGAGVNFSWTIPLFVVHSLGDRKLLWQTFDLEAVQKMLDLSVTYIQMPRWRPDFGVTRLQFASSTLECIVGIFRHVDLFQKQGTKYAFQNRIVGWIERIINSITLNSHEPSSVLTLREHSGIVAAISATKRALDANSFLPFKNGHVLNELIENILDQQLRDGIKISEVMFEKIQVCFNKLDEYAKEYSRRSIVIASDRYIPMSAEDLHTADELIHELITRTVKGLFIASDFLLQMVNAKREDLATAWLFVVRKIIDKYSFFRPDTTIWSELSRTEQEVFKRNILIATTTIDRFLLKQVDGETFFCQKAMELGLESNDKRGLDLSADLSTLRWLSPVLENAILREITKYQPTYGDTIQSDDNTPYRSHEGRFPQRTRFRHNSRDRGTFTNSFESQVFGYVRAYLQKLQDAGSIKSFILQPNIRVFKCEIDLVIELRRADNSPYLLLLECAGESWHSTFGVSNHLDVTKIQVKTSPVLWNLLGVKQVPEIITIPHREFKSRRGHEQRSYVEDLIRQRLF